MHLKDLPELTNIIDKLVVDPVETLEFVIDNDEYIQIYEALYQSLDEYTSHNINIYQQGSYKDSLKEHLSEELDTLFEQELHQYKDHEDFDDFYDDYIEFKDAMIQHVIETYECLVPPRSHSSNPVLFSQSEQYKRTIDQSLEYIRTKDADCPPQRSMEWHQQRYNLMSASTAWKVVDKDNYRNAYIYDKCKPLDTNKFAGVNINTPFHWGTKFEPVSQAYYEHVYNVKVEEFGCIPHRTHDCMGASPDGIITTRSSDRYGRMLEIKNIYNRDITGIPKKEYWVQTQYQMECCNLDECDFLECRFKLYENEDEFENDGTFSKSEQGYYKGIIMCFYVNEEPHYEYMPFQCSREECETWQDEMMEKHKNNSWVKNDYYYLQEVSCVLIQRNRKWFSCLTDTFLNTWKTIIHERVHGYEHRKPKKRSKKTQDKSTMNHQKTVIQLLKLDNNETTPEKQGSTSMNPLLFRSFQKTENSSTINDATNDTETLHKPAPKPKKTKKQTQLHPIITIDTTTV